MTPNTAQVLSITTNFKVPNYNSDYKRVTGLLQGVLQIPLYL